MTLHWHPGTPRKCTGKDRYERMTQWGFGLHQAKSITADAFYWNSAGGTNSGRLRDIHMVKLANLGLSNHFPENEIRRDPQVPAHAVWFCATKA